jgi:hypothetical protein
VSLTISAVENRSLAAPEDGACKGVSICFQCVDAAALLANGIEIKDPFVGNNIWVVAFKDPDGYRPNFESPTDVPEETTYLDWMKQR